MISPQRKLRTTTVFDTYWRFAFERQEVFHKRVAGMPEPWTEDPILQGYRFTNVYRASDRASQYLIKHVIYAGEQSLEEVVFRTLLFKFFNRIETWESLSSHLGEITWAEFSVKRYDAIFSQLLEQGKRLYSGAYIMPCPTLGASRKHSNHLKLLARMMKDDLPLKAAAARSLRQLVEVLRAYPSIGDFLAFQFAIDLNYGTSTAFSENDYVLAGPGAKSGIRKAFVDTDGLSDDDVIMAVSYFADREFERRGLEFRTLWGRQPQLIDCQNVFCELDKYSRVAHPSVAGLGRKRMKRRFRPGRTLDRQWYPPKWDIHPE